ncbi:hypothetical protein HII31_04125 [Pseudocercospora fuligena]|uniref:DUF1996 domain-containing protein n=1 Tax=Pseudocercospora fuligena TaxID=685502 RepID=A0A8H6RNF4_9PEZI|nr:hypothetical protein HII31_04125 [Pseudocercospora fuligena]
MMKATFFTAAMASTAMGAQFVMYTPGGDDTAVERMDSIVTPGGISAHVHQIFGANKMSPDMTYDSLQESDCTTVSNAAGDGNAADKSVYWHPALFAEASDGSGYIRIPTSGHKLYYRDVGNTADKKADPFEFPKGFRMVAGDQTLRAANSDSQHQTITEWICHSSGSQNKGENGGFPTGVSDCDAYPGFNGAIHFPHCWNGEDFDQSKPGAHVSYPEGDVQAGPCPSSHPIRVPHIFIENQFDLHKVKDQVKPDSFVLAQGDPTGYGWHADFFNGWESGAIPELMKSCPAPYYGNADIGTCPSFKKFSTKSSDCKLKTTFDEDVSGPTKFLPGCNPISSTSPAPKMSIAALGVCTDTCSAASGSSGSGSNSSPPTYESNSSSEPEAEPSTTMATYYGASSTSAAAATATGYGAASYGNYGSYNENVENAVKNIVYETAYVTVTADSYEKREAAPTADAHHKHAMRHIHRHKRGNL